MNFKPLNDRVILKRIRIKETTPSGLIIPATTSENSDMLYGKVIATGPGKIQDGIGLVPTVVQEGDIVIFRPNMAFSYTYQGTDYLIIREGELASIVEGIEESDLPEYSKDAFKVGPKELESLL